MLLECSLGLVKEAKALESAVQYILDEEGLRTKDLGGSCSTKQVGDAVRAAFKKNLAALYH